MSELEYNVGMPDQPDSMESDESDESEPEEVSTRYFKDNDDREGVKGFISTGSTMFDMILGGGWALGRISNLYGGPSTGKTQCAIEAVTNFLLQYENGECHYVEPEAAFDENYAMALGCPMDAIEFTSEIDTIEAFDNYVESLLKRREQENEQDRPLLLVLDSLDALSDMAEMERNISDSSYGAGKARKLSEVMRRINKRLNKNNGHLMIISQTRENIGSPFGGAKVSGGKALEFYSSQRVELKHKGKVEPTVKGIKRAVGIDVGVMTKKNKTAPPFRETNIKIYFEYGIDNLSSNIEFIRQADELDQLGITKEKAKRIESNPLKLNEDEYDRLQEQSDNIVKELWPQIEGRFRPKKGKYQRG